MYGLYPAREGKGTLSLSVKSGERYRLHLKTMPGRDPAHPPVAKYRAKESLVSRLWHLIQFLFNLPDGVEHLL